jgi:mannose-6-phosphate isomerase
VNYKELLKHPVFFEPNRVWRCYTGGHLMDAFRGTAETLDNHFPEDWLGSTTIAINGPNQQYVNEGLSRVKMSDGSKGPFFKDILKQCPGEALGQKEFLENDGLGVLCKFLDSAIRLPIQCHPDIPFAQKNYNSDHGKTESWFILGTRKINDENPYILMGFKENVEMEKFKEAVRQENIIEMEKSLHRVEVSPGEMYIIPGRLPHAIGQGVFLLEVQEPTDWVVQPERFIGDTELSHTDMWGPLEPETGLDCFDYDSRDTKENILKKVSLTPYKTEKIDGGLIDKIIGSKITTCFSVDRLVITDSVDIDFKDKWHLAIVTKDTCMLKTGGQENIAKQGDCFFISHNLTQLKINIADNPAEIYLITN